MNTQMQQSNYWKEENDSQPFRKVPEADWSESLECLLLLGLVAVVAASFMWTVDSTIHTLWTTVMTQMHVALTQSHTG